MDDLLEKIDYYLHEERDADVALQALQTLREEAISLIKEYKWKIRNSFETVNESTNKTLTSEEASKIALENTYAESPIIYTKIVDDAISKNEEFGYLAFAAPLFDVGRDQYLYNIKIKGTGWKRTALVNLRMNEVAGDINDYAAAVIKVRKELRAEQEKRMKAKPKDKRTKVRENSPATASMLWKRYYLSKDNEEGTYSNTIARRVGHFNSIAPFWSILDSGNKISMASNWGGTAYPNQRGTRFVDKVEKAISKFFETKLLSYKNNGLTTTTTKEVATDTTSLKEAVWKVEDLIREVDAAVIRLEEHFEEPEVYIEALNKDIERIDKSKFMNALRQFKRGSPKERIRVGKGDDDYRISQYQAELLRPYFNKE